MSSVDAKMGKEGAVLPHCVGQDNGDDAANDDHNYTKNYQSKKEDVIVTSPDMKHNADVCQEVIKVLKSEETVPEWELDLSDSNDSKENLHKMVIKSDTPVTDINSNSATCSVSKPKFNLSNILPIPANISVQRFSPSLHGEQLSSVSPSSNYQENISMVPPPSLSKKVTSSEVKDVQQAEGSKTRGYQAHTVKEQWVVKKSRVTKTAVQTVSEKLTPIPSMPGYIFAGQQSEPEPEEGPPCKKVKKSPSFHQPATPGHHHQVIRSELVQASAAVRVQYQTIRPDQAQPEPFPLEQHQVIRPDKAQPSPARPGQHQVIRPSQSQPNPAPEQYQDNRPGQSQSSPAAPGQYQVIRPDQAHPSLAPGQLQVIRPEQAQPRPALIRPVRPGRPRSDLTSKGRGAPRWPPPSQMLAHSRSLPTSVSPRHPLRFPPQRFSKGGPAHIPPQRRHPIYQFPKASPGMNHPEAVHSQAFSQHQYKQVSTPPYSVPSNSIASLPSHPQVSRLPPSLSVSRVSSRALPVLPLQTLATALAGLGMLEGRKKVVQLNLTVSQIEALSILGIREEDG